MNIIGRQTEVGVGLEGTRGTPATISRWIKKVTASVLPKVEKVVDDSTVGVLEDSIGARISKKWFDGDIGGVLHADVIGYFFMNLFGSVSEATEETGVYSHEFSLDQTIEHPTLTVFRKDGDSQNEKYGGGVVNTLEISATTEDYVRFTANVILANGATSTEPVSYEDETDFIGRDITIKMADTEGGLTGATPLVVKGLTLTINSNAVSDFKFGSYNPDVYNSGFAIELELTKNYEDTTFEDLFIGNDYKYMEIKIAGEALIGATKKAEITLLLNKAQVQAWERAGDANALVEETVTIKAFYNETDTQMSLLTLQNNTASYVPAS